MHLHQNCFACDLVRGTKTAPGGIIFENAHWQVDHVNHPVLLRGMLIVRLKRHCEQFADVTPEEAATLGGVIQLVSAALLEAVHPERVYVCLFGESLRHVHFFIIPRMPNMPRGSWGAFTWLRLQNVLFQLKFRKAHSHDEIVQLAETLRQICERLSANPLSSE